MTDKQLSFRDTSVAFASKSTKELRKMNFLFSLMGAPELTKVGTFFIKTLLKLHFPIKKIIKSTLFQQFCGGETLDSCQITINQLYKSNIQSILDFSAEGESNEIAYEQNLKELEKTIVLASKETKISFCVCKITSLGSSELLAKMQEHGFDLTKEENEGISRIRKRVAIICEKAYQFNVKLLIDAEESWIQGAIDQLVLEQMKEVNRDLPILYNTYQLYRIDGLDRLHHLVALAQKEKFIPAVKLVRGAYMEKETIRARTMNYVSPIHSSKAATDDAFDKGLSFCIHNKVALCAGSHNERSMLLLTQLMKIHGIRLDDQSVHFAQLYGMSDHISVNLSNAGYRVSKYVPYGPLELVMPYLFRRAEENTSVVGQMGRELTLIRTELRRRKK